MTDYIIPCDVVARLGRVAFGHQTSKQIMRTLRLDNGQVVATNDRVLIIENIGGFVGIAHIVVDQALLTQCEFERQFHSQLYVSVNEMLGMGWAKSTLGYNHSMNCYMPAPAVNDFDQWRAIAARAAAPLEQSAKFGMCWQTECLDAIVKSSPSGDLIMDINIDPIIKPVLICDVNDPNWIAVTRPFDPEKIRRKAQFPTWLASEE